MLALLKYLPARSTLAGGLSSLSVWALGLLLAHFGIILPPGVVSGAVAVVGAVVTHLVPDSVNDMAKQLNVDVVKLQDVIPEIKSGPGDYPDSVDRPR